MTATPGHCHSLTPVSSAIQPLLPPVAPSCPQPYTPASQRSETRSPSRKALHPTATVPLSACTGTILYSAECPTLLPSDPPRQPLSWPTLPPPPPPAYFAAY